MARINVKSVILTTLMLAFFGLIFVFYMGYKSLTGKKYIKYWELSNLDYTVCFKETNDFYEKECLPDDINNYVTKYIDNVRISFDYKLNLSRKIDVDYRYSVVAELTIFDSNNHAYIMNKKEYVLVNEKRFENDKVNRVDVAELVKLDYGEYNKFVNNYKSSANVPAGANLKVIFRVTSSGNYSGKDLSKISKNMSVDIPLGESTIQFKSDNNKDNSSKDIEIDIDSSIVSYIFLVSSYLSGFMCCVLFIRLIVMANKKYKKKPIYDRFIARLKSDYDADITNLTNLIDTEYEEKYEYLDAPNFKELYEVIKANTNKKIYWNEKKYYDKNNNLENRVSWFFVFIEEKKVVRLIIDENKFAEEYKKDKKIISSYRG